MGTFVTAGAAPPVFVDATPPQGLPGEFDASHVNDIWGALVDVRTHSSGFINVKSYGATGNGSTDDTTAIQAAATAAAGKTLRFPQGSYKISARIDHPDHAGRDRLLRFRRLWRHDSRLHARRSRLRLQAADRGRHRRRDHLRRLRRRAHRGTLHGVWLLQRDCGNVPYRIHRP
jgi:hypothetical protein